MVSLTYIPYGDRLLATTHFKVFLYNFEKDQESSVTTEEIHIDDPNKP